MTARGDAALTAAIVATKAATIGFAVDAFLNADSPRLRGKAIRTRAIGYVGALFIVPVAWRLLPERDGYPRVLDLAVTVPLLLDAGGNAFGLYERAYIDDVVHLTNSAIVSAVAGELLAPQCPRPPACRARGCLGLDRGRDRLGDHGVRGDATRRERDGPHLRGHDGGPHRRRRRRGDRSVRHRRAVAARSTDSAAGAPGGARSGGHAGVPPDVDGRSTPPDLGRSRHAAHRARRLAHPDRPGPRRPRRAAPPAGPRARSWRPRADRHGPDLARPSRSFRPRVAGTPRRRPAARRPARPGLGGRRHRPSGPRGRPPTSSSTLAASGSGRCPPATAAGRCDPPRVRSAISSKGRPACTSPAIPRCTRRWRGWPGTSMSRCCRSVAGVRRAVPIGSIPPPRSMPPGWSGRGRRSPSIGARSTFRASRAGRWGWGSVDAGEAFAREARAHAAQLDVRVLRPGETTDLEPD